MNPVQVDTRMTAPTPPPALQATTEPVTPARVLRVITPAPHHVWDDLARNDSKALVTQTSAWMRGMEATGRYKDASRLYEFGDGRRLVLTLARRTGPVGAVLGNEGFPTGWGIGGLVGDELTSCAVRAVLEDLQASRLSRVQIRPNPINGSIWRAGCPEQGVIVTPRRAHVIDVREGADHVWNILFSQSARRSVRKGEKAGLEVEYGSDARLAAEYHALFMKSVERWAGKQHEPVQLARMRAHWRDSLHKWETLGRVMGPGCTFWIARLHGEPVGAMVLLSGPNGHETRSAIDREKTTGVDPTYLLTWLGIKHAVEHGAQWYHLGETGSSTSLADFKQRFGGVPYDYADYRIERIPVTKVDRGARSLVKKALRFQD